MFFSDKAYLKKYQEAIDLYKQSSQKNVPSIRDGTEAELIEMGIEDLKTYFNQRIETDLENSLQINPLYK